MDAHDLSLDDNGTIQAIGILADVLDGVEGPGGLDTVLVSKALRQVIATKSQPAFEFASRAFNTLDRRSAVRWRKARTRRPTMRSSCAAGSAASCRPPRRSRFPRVRWSASSRTSSPR
ncbi:hypothetical protein [Azospirillum sp. INR13]|uniref:hypothetical protein n=1 Tax=Azospirillum sp. INR13 TaxID=2596919 RepID=UPI0021060B82|nr:hypothetical protein [Azospirillum sp. INR13]